MTFFIFRGDFRVPEYDVHSEDSGILDYPPPILPLPANGCENGQVARLPFVCLSILVRVVCVIRMVTDMRIHCH